MGYAFAICAGIAAFLFGWGLGGPVVGVLLAAAATGFFFFEAGWQASRKKAPPSSPHSESPMPININRGDSATLGHFVLRSNGNEVILPTQYGYWSVRWSVDNASGAIEDIVKNTPSNHPTLAKHILEKEFLGHMQFIALHAAVYWVYATAVLRVPTAVVNQMQIGIQDGIKDLLTPDGQPYSADMVELFKASFARYYNAMQLDFSADADKNAFNPNVNELAKCAVTIFSKLFPQFNVAGTNQAENAHLEMERMSFSHMVADLPVGLMVALKEHLELEFVAAPAQDSS